MLSKILMTMPSDQR